MKTFHSLLGNWLLTSVLLAFFNTTSVYSATQTYSKLIIFGDSLSDTGNAASLVTLPYPFYQNRLSDGPLAVDHLATHLGLSAQKSNHLYGSIAGSNYAVGGANALGTQAEDLGPQISAYLQHVNYQTDPNAVYLIAIGGNDIRGIRALTPSAVSAEITRIAQQIYIAANNLLSRGAKTLLIANIPDIGRIPESIADGTSITASAHSRTLNVLISTHISALQNYQSANIALFDFYSHFTRILSQANHHGFTQTTVGCYTFPLSFHSVCDYGQRFDRFVFFDSIHPSAKTHTLIGQALIETLENVVTSSHRRTSIAPIITLLLN